MAAKTYITFVLDESGSMETVRDATIEGFNSYIDELRKDENAASMRFTLVKFDSTHQTVVHEAVKLKHVEHLTRETYRPGATTPLVDASMLAIKSAEEQAGRKHKVLIAIQTDGLENASREFTKNELKAKIEVLTRQGWVFSFLGAGIDAYASGAAFGIRSDTTMSYDKSADGTRATFAATAASHSRGASGGDVAYTNEEKLSAGDKRKRA